MAVSVGFPFRLGALVGVFGLEDGAEVWVIPPLCEIWKSRRMSLVLVIFSRIFTICFSYFFRMRSLAKLLETPMVKVFSFCSIICELENHVRNSGELMVTSISPSTAFHNCKRSWVIGCLYSIGRNYFARTVVW